MYGFIGSSEYYKEVKEFVSSQQENFEYKIIGEDIEILVELAKVSQVKIKHLIIDITSLIDAVKIIEAVKEFKLLQPKTQIIIIVPLQYIPGNMIMSELVKLGVYDIIRREIEQDNLEDFLLDHVIHPTPYRTAKQWECNELKIEANKDSDTKSIDTIDQDLSDKNDFVYKEDSEEDYPEEDRQEEDYSEEDYPEEDYLEEKKFFIQNKKVVERTITIIQEKIVGTAVIAVAGTIKRIGVTHNSISIANFLSAKGFKVGVIELHPSKHFDVIKSSYEGIEERENYFQLNGIYFYPYKKNLTLTDILQEEFNYLILDMGLYGNSNIDEFHRANKKILISGVKEWEIPKLEQILLDKDKNIYINKYLYAFNFTSDESFQFMENSMAQMSCFKLEFNPDPFQVTEQAAISFEKILQEVLPGEHRKKSKNMFDFLKGKRR